MISEPGRVISSRNGEVEIACQVQTACHSCKAKSNCGTSALAKVFPGQTQVVKLKAQQNYEPGQKVELNIAEIALVKAAIAVYGIPLVGLMLGAILGFQLITWFNFPTSWFSPDIGAIIGAVFGLISGLFGAKIYHQRLSRSGQFQLSIK
ncbi:SoxR reducing system RseC family protein [Motilimonas pumila]|uniref:Uncharacterized protein n=1 Tax=Motilimonas pumila TaxID=2303987 RepID=A0A418Y9M9_9GAMM|nr:SoxR reducing system RseC family protein [Motilimonas pumila]RJG37969.1 hypothetical protein D1Z90_19460 [Motilimonas pumila]